MAIIDHQVVLLRDIQLIEEPLMVVLLQVIQLIEEFPILVPRRIIHSFMNTGEIEMTHLQGIPIFVNLHFSLKI